MTKPLMKLLQKYQKLIIILIVAVFITLLFFGFYLGPDKLMRPPPSLDTQEQIP